MQPELKGRMKRAADSIEAATVHGDGKAKSSEKAGASSPPRKSRAKEASGLPSTAKALDRQAEAAVMPDSSFQTQQFGQVVRLSATKYELKSDTVGLMTFPERLNMLLNRVDVQNVMWWLPGGDCFCLVPANFDCVLNRHFHGTKFESFTRKLNRWLVLIFTHGKRLKVPFVAYIPNSRCIAGALNE